MNNDEQFLPRLRAFYERVPVLITGGASFIGSHLAELLLTSGAAVAIIDDLSSGRPENLSSISKDIHFTQGDVRDPATMASATAGRRVVFHLANAHGGRGYIDTHPVESVNNLVCDHVVFSAAARAGCERIVYAGSACAYPTSLQAHVGQSVLLREGQAGFDEPGKAFADGEYGWSKLIGELQLTAFHKQFGVDTVACRIFTAYGPRENESHAVIALIAKAIARLDPYPIWGDGRQTRNFTYVKDTAMGLALSGACPRGAAAINIGTDRHTTINDLIEAVFESLNWRPSQIRRELDKPVGVLSRAADLDTCRRILGWEPQWDLDTGLAETIAWYTQNVDPTRLANLDYLLMTR